MTRPRDLPAPLRAMAEAALAAVGGPATPARAARRRPVAATKRREAAPDLFPAVCAAHGLPAPVAEFRFCERKWAVDYAWPAHRVALEVEGWGHRTKKRFTSDLAKYNRLAALGWRLVRCTPKTRDHPATLAAVRAALTTGAP